MAGIRVLIADDSPACRNTLRPLLAKEADIEVVAEAADGRTAVELAGAERPDVVIMDIEMPVMDGIEATREIRGRWPGVQVVALTLYDRPAFREAMATAGASGYMLKDGELGDLLAAIRQAARGEGDSDNNEIEDAAAAAQSD